MSSLPSNFRDTSLETTPTKYTDPRLRISLLSLFERESKVTRIRMGQALSVSRMTAHRIAEQLISEELLTETAGIDPHSGRHSALLMLSPEPPLLLTDVWEEEPTMFAYFCCGKKISTLSAPYNFIHHTVGNHTKLARMCQQYWNLPANTPCVTLHHPDNLLSGSFSSLFNPYTVIDHGEAVARTMKNHLAFQNYRTLLYLRVGTHLSLNLYAREYTQDPWFEVSGSKLSTSCSAPDQLSPTALERFLESYCTYIHPDAVVIEDLTESKSSSGRCHLHTLPSFGSRFTITEHHPIAKAIERCSPHTQVLVCQNSLPLWVSGAIALRREERWLKSSLTD